MNSECFIILWSISKLRTTRTWPRFRWTPIPEDRTGIVHRRINKRKIDLMLKLKSKIIVSIFILQRSDDICKPLPPPMSLKSFPALG